MNCKFLSNISEVAMEPSVVLSQKIDSEMILSWPPNLEGEAPYILTVLSFWRLCSFGEVSLFINKKWNFELIFP